MRKSTVNTNQSIADTNKMDKFYLKQLIELKKFDDVKNHLKACDKEELLSSVEIDLNNSGSYGYSTYYINPLLWFILTATTEETKNLLSMLKEKLDFSILSKEIDITSGFCILLTKAFEFALQSSDNTLKKFYGNWEPKQHFSALLFNCNLKNFIENKKIEINLYNIHHLMNWMNSTDKSEEELVKTINWNKAKYKKTNEYSDFHKYLDFYYKTHPYINDIYSSLDNKPTETSQWFKETINKECPSTEDLDRFHFKLLRHLSAKGLETGKLLLETTKQRKEVADDLIIAMHHHYGRGTVADSKIAEQYYVTAFWEADKQSRILQTSKDKDNAFYYNVIKNIALAGLEKLLEKDNGNQNLKHNVAQCQIIRAPSKLLSFEFFEINPDISQITALNSFAEQALKQSKSNAALWYCAAFLKNYDLQLLDWGTKLSLSLKLLDYKKTDERAALFNIYQKVLEHKNKNPNKIQKILDAYTTLFNSNQFAPYRLQMILDKKSSKFLNLITTSEDKKLFEDLKKLCEEQPDYLPTQLALAKFYEEGFGTDKNIPEAIKNYGVVLLALINDNLSDTEKLYFKKQQEQAKKELERLKTSKYPEISKLATSQLPTAPLETRVGTAVPSNTSSQVTTRRNSFSENDVTKIKEAFFNPTPKDLNEANTNQEGIYPAITKDDKRNIDILNPESNGQPSDYALLLNPNEKQFTFEIDAVLPEPAPKNNNISKIGKNFEIKKTVSQEKLLLENVIEKKPEPIHKNNIDDSLSETDDVMKFVKAAFDNKDKKIKILEEENNALKNELELLKKRLSELKKNKNLPELPEKKDKVVQTFFQHAPENSETNKKTKSRSNSLPPSFNKQ